MNESMKPRFAIDLDEIERQLAQAQAGTGRAAPTPQSSRHDPLAELARIVGQEDPFQSLLSPQDDRRRELSRQSQGRPQGRLEPQIDDFAEEFEETTSHRPDARAYAAHPAREAYQEPAASREANFEEFYDPRYDELAAQEPVPPLPSYEHLHRAADRGSRKGFYAVVAIVGAGAVGLGGAYMLRSPSAGASGEPPLVHAAQDPVKVAPQTPGGVEIPNQNKQIYERAGSETETRVVNQQEQPVDVREAARSAEATGAVQGGPGGLNLGEPRKVRTIAIRPDGSVITNEPQTQTQAAARPPVQPNPAQANRVASAAETPVKASPQATPPAPAAAAPSNIAGASPQATAPVTPAARPAAAPAPQRVANAQPVAAAPVPAEAATTAPAPAAGTFSIQLGVASSETDAKATLQKLQQKYADLAGLSPQIRKADINGNTVYRVRVGPMAREDASALCTKLQGQGGQCFIAKN